jgi:kinesin family protein C2/C3
MFVHVSPDCDSYGETISTLKFAERVSTVELGAAQSNKESSEVKDLKDQVYDPSCMHSIEKFVYNSSI